MPNTIKIKNSGTASAVPSSLATGELALNYNDGRLYYKNAASQIVAYGGVTDGDKGDIVVSNGGTTWSLDTGVVSSFSRTLLDDTSAASARTTLGAASQSDPTISGSVSIENVSAASLNQYPGLILRKEPISGTPGALHLAGLVAFESPDGNGVLRTMGQIQCYYGIAPSGSATNGVMSIWVADGTGESRMRHQWFNDGKQNSTPIGSTSLLPACYCRGWIRFNGDLASISSSISNNVSSVADNGVGNYTVYWDVDMPDENYAVAACGKNTNNSSSENSIVAPYGFAAGSVGLRTQDGNTAVDCAIICVSVFR